MPLITPAVERVKPAGSVELDAIDQSTAPLLSQVLMICEYATPTEASGSDVLLNSVNGATLSVRVLTPKLPLASSALTVNVKVPVASGTLTS